MLKLDRVSKRLGGFELEGVSFAVDPGDYFVLLGESGAGKTIILEMIAGLLAPDGGSIEADGRDLARVPIQERGLGLVYQDHALFPHMNVRRNIGYALGKRPERVAELASLVGVSDLLERKPTTLSLGESQRVALARTLATEPRILMLDEPLASLDVQAKAQIRSLLRRLHGNGQTIVHVTHDYREALALATKVAVLEGGTVSQVGTPDEVFHHPKSKFVAEFVGIKNFFHGLLSRDAGADTAVFRTGRVSLTVSTDAPPGPGCVVFESDAITVSLEEPHSSARNAFHGRIVDMEPVPLGTDLSIDIGITVHAIVTRGSRERMGLDTGGEVWVSFKSTAVRFVEE